MVFRITLLWKYWEHLIIYLLVYWFIVNVYGSPNRVNTLTVRQEERKHRKKLQKVSSRNRKCGTNAPWKMGWSKIKETEQLWQIIYLWILHLFDLDSSVSDLQMMTINFLQLDCLVFDLEVCSRGLHNERWRTTFNRREVLICGRSSW